MEKLFEYSNRRIKNVDTRFKRYLYNEINWDVRLIVITGARGVGKTTLLLQYMKEQLNHVPDEEKMFVNLDDLYFTKISLVDFADQFVKQGGRYLFLDEVHKYPGWSREIKNIYDYFEELKIIVTGSSALNIHKGNVDLSRRALHYRLPGLSFREFIELKYQKYFPSYKLDDILKDPNHIIDQILSDIKPLKYFPEYLEKGYFPFFAEDEIEYHSRLKQTINHVLDNDLPLTSNIDYTAIYHIKKLLAILAENVPYTPNISKLSEQIEVSRETLIKYLYLLEQADLLLLLKSDRKGMAKMNKPEKVYLANTNIFAALTDTKYNAGTLREVFFYSQLKPDHQLASSPHADFKVDDRYTFEIGGKRKGGKQIEDVAHAYIAADNIEYAYKNKIPLWLFGFLY